MDNIPIFGAYLQRLVNAFSNTPNNTPSVIGNPSQMKLSVGVSPNFVNQMQPQTVDAADPNYRFAFETQKRDQNYANLTGRGGFQPQQPPQDIGQIIRNTFPNEATTAALVAATENGTYNPTVKDNPNSDGSVDRGLFQINNHTFNGLMQKFGDRLRTQGINSYEDMYDPAKNAAIAKMIYDQNGWGRWFGWQNKGYDLNGGYYSQPERIKYEIAKRGGKYKEK